VIDQAKNLQGDLASQEGAASSLKVKPELPVQQLEFNLETRKERVASQRVMDELAQVNPLEMTPIEALTKIAKWQDSYL